MHRSQAFGGIALALMLGGPALAQTDAVQPALEKPLASPANDRNEYAHERNLRVSGAPTKTRDGGKRLSDDSTRADGPLSPARDGTGVFENHPVTGVSR